MNKTIYFNTTKYKTNQNFLSKSLFHRTAAEPDHYHKLMRAINRKEEDQTPQQKARQEQLVKQLDKSFEKAPQDSRFKTLVGESATRNYYNHYKKLERILDQNQFHSVNESPFTALLQNSKTNFRLPLRYGVVKDRGAHDKITNNHFASGDTYYQIMLQGIKDSRNHKQFQISNNRISRKGAKSILPAIAAKAKKLDMSRNKIGDEGLFPLTQYMKQQKLRLQKLNLSKSNLGDKAVIQLCSSLASQKSVRQLNLSSNKISSKSASALAQLIDQNYNLIELYLKWNSLAAGAAQIFQQLINNDNLKVLDLGWNHIAGSAACDAFCNVLKGNCSLLHLDLESNNFSYEECKLIAEALQNNHTLYGFHFQGNYGYIDSNGFLVIQDQFKDMNQIHISTQINGISVTTSLHHFPNEVYKNVCWVCEGWNQFQFNFYQEHLDVDDCWLHLNFNGYNSTYMGKMRPQMNRLWSVPMMIPPGKTLYFFTYDGQQEVYSKQPKIESINSEIIRNIRVNGELKTLLIEQKNYVIKEKKNLFYEDYDLAVSIKPRVNFLFQIAKKVRQLSPWSFPKSIWYNEYRVQTPHVLNQCFERDFSMSKINKLSSLKQPQLLQGVKAILKEKYKIIKETYRYYSCISPTGDIFCISQNPFTDFCHSSKITDAKLMPLKTIDLKRIATLSASLADWKGNPRNPQKSIVRYQFIQVLVRIAQQKYFASGTLENCLLAVQRLIKQLQPFMKSIDYQSWREERYYNEACDFLLKKHKPLLRHVYDRYSVLKVKPSEPKFMCLDEFKNLCLKMELDKFNIVERDIFISFNFGMMTQVDQLESQRFFKMTYLEFLQSFARIIDQSSLIDPSKPQPLSLADKLQFALKNLVVRCASMDYLANMQKQTQAANPTTSKEIKLT